MDSAQQFSVVAGAVILPACGVLYRNRRGWNLVFTSISGAALGAIIFPCLLGLAMGYQAAINSPLGRFWRSEFRDIGLFYTLAPVADTVPRGAGLGLLAGLVARGVWLRGGRRSRLSPEHGRIDTKFCPPTQSASPE